MAPNTLDPVTKKPDDDIVSNGNVRSRIISEKARDGDSTTTSHSTSNGDVDKSKEFKPQIRWPDLFAQVFIHAGFLYGLYYLIALKAKFYTYVWCKCGK